MSKFFGPDVEEITLKDFKTLPTPGGKVSLDFINPRFAGKSGMVISYAPWCPHCHNMAPEVMELARVTKGLYPIGAINSDDHANGNNIVNDYLKVSGYPSVKIWNEGKFKDYTGGRSLQEMLRFLCMENGLCELI